MSEMPFAEESGGVALLLHELRQQHFVLVDAISGLRAGCAQHADAVGVAAGEEPGAMWTGPVVSRGMSRSGLMHTMAGHGPFETEPCAVYGY